MTPLLGFAPDAESSTPGIITDCVNFIPYLNGMEGAPSRVTPTDIPALVAVCTGAGVVEALDGTRRVFSGTPLIIYELTGGAWVDAGRAADYTGGTSARWMFAQNGNATIATNRTDAMQRATTGNFADLGGGAPKAEIVFTVGSFVMAMNVNDGAEKTDGWHCSASYDDTDWNENIDTQSASGRLVASPGPITAGASLGEYAIAYKASSIYLGQYVGAPAVWSWSRIPGGEAGCVGKEAICDIGGAHFFVGKDNFWLFDGSRPVPLADGILRDWFYTNSNPIALEYAICKFDKKSNRVWVFYPSTDSSTLDSALVYHLKTKRWGRANMSIQAALDYIAQGLTYAGLASAYSTYADLPDIPYGSPIWSSGAQAFSVFNTSNQLQHLTGTSTSSSFTTGDVGDDNAVTLLQSVRLRFNNYPATSTVATSYAMNKGGGYTPGPTGTLNDGKFDVMKSARWHSATFSFTGDVQVTHAEPTFKIAGRR